MHRYSSFVEAIKFLAQSYEKGCLWSILRLDMDAFYVFRSEPTNEARKGIQPVALSVSPESAKFGAFSPYHATDEGPGRHSEESLIENFDNCIQHWRSGFSSKDKMVDIWPPRIGIINSHTPCISGVMSQNLGQADQKPSASRMIGGMIYPESCAFKLATLRATVKDSFWYLSWYAVHKYGEVKETSPDQWQELEIKRCLVPLGFDVGRVSKDEYEIAREVKLKL